MRTSKLKQKALSIVDDTVKFYSEDPSRRSRDDEGFCYYTDYNGNHCAVGRHLPENILKKVKQESLSADALIDKYYTKTGTLKGLGRIFWSGLQSIHDEDGNWTPEGLSDHGKINVEDIKEIIKNSTDKELKL